MVTNYLIIEDELLAAKRLQRLIEDVSSDYQIQNHVSSISEAIEFFAKGNRPDLIFMDIQLTDGLAFSILEKCEVESPIIFTTAYEEYAVCTNRANAVGFLLKPIKEQELEKVLSKIKFLQGIDLKFDFKKFANQPVIITNYGDKHYLITAEEIAYMYSSQGITVLVKYDGQKIPVRISFQKLIDQLCSTGFKTISSDTIVNFDAIKGYHYKDGVHRIMMGDKEKTYLTIDPPFVDDIIDRGQSKYYNYLAN